jgi:hypothetical protein
MESPMSRALGKSLAPKDALRAKRKRVQTVRVFIR